MVLIFAAQMALILAVVHTGFYNLLHSEDWKEIEQTKENEQPSKKDTDGQNSKKDNHLSAIQNFFRVVHLWHCGLPDIDNVQGSSSTKNSFHQILERHLFPRMAQVQPSFYFKF